ncbi:MAG: dephospho-CoA kinase [Chitinophagaceae bacterium]|jgi:dephospho-CoA kinase|nr:dephospho-CoA kinase [Chitinophagaceae bacterium]
MLKVGITGGIGSGKSMVSHIFNLLGVPVFDADKAAKQVMLDNKLVREQLINSFGENVYLNYELNRSYLAKMVFSDEHLLKKLNAIVHPATIEEGEKWVSKQTAPYVIKEAALLFEAGSAEDLDYIIGVFAPQHIRINRVMKRDNVSRQDVLNRMSKQIDEAIKMKLCDFVIVNDEQQMVIPQVLNLHKQFMEEASKLSKEHIA